MLNVREVTKVDRKFRRGRIASQPASERRAFDSETLPLVPFETVLTSLGLFRRRDVKTQEKENEKKI